MSRTFVPPPDFDARIALLRESQAAIAAHGGDWRRTTALLRNAAYNAALTYIAIQREQHDQLLDYIRGRGLRTVHAFIEELFGGLVGTGIQPQLLITAIQEGFTLADWSQQRPEQFLLARKGAKAKRKSDAQRTPDDWRALVARQRREIADLHRALNAARDELRRKQQEILCLMRNLGATCNARRTSQQATRL